MASRKATSAAAADSQKKRKRDKVEDAGRSKKRKPEETGNAKEAHGDSRNSSSSGSKQIGQLVSSSSSRAMDGRPSTWQLSEPMGGFMADIDPIFTADEKHLILVYNTSIQVYATADSLLERRIKLPHQANGTASDSPGRVVAAVLSPQSPDVVWVGCADGTLFRVDWRSGAVEHVPRKETPAPPLAGLSAELVRFGSGTKEVLFLAEGAGSDGGPTAAWRVAAYDAGALAKTAGRTLFTTPSGSSGSSSGSHHALGLLRTADHGRFVVAASGATVFVAGLKTTKTTDDVALPSSLADLTYQVFSLDAPDDIACLDVQTALKKKGAALHLVLGCVRGAIYAYSDVFSRLRRATAEGPPKKNAALQPRKHHWHRRSVHAVKWSKDCNYFISGGPEAVLVLWQADTSKVDFLPHLSASIENIVISPRGASYAVHLDDNSTMVVSTAEMTPTCYVSGLQSLVLGQTPPKDAHVRRTWQPLASSASSSSFAITRPVPAVVDPTNAARVWLRVGNGQRASSSLSTTTADSSGGDGPSLSAALLQTFDVASFQSVAKQPLARTNPTDANMTVLGYPLTEPTVTQLCASRDGQWLASVDEWQPPARDISGVHGEASLQEAWARERREVHLKFWAVHRSNPTEQTASGSGSDGDKNGDKNGDHNAASTVAYELVTRVDEAHFTTKAETILGVAADSQHAGRFATLGDDAVVRFWGIRARMQDGLAAKDPATGRPLVSWHCTMAVPLPLGAAHGSSRHRDDDHDHDDNDDHDYDHDRVRAGSVPRDGPARRSGALTYSEDGSTVFAAFGGPDEAVVYTIDAESGVVRDTLPDLFRGDVRGVASLGPALVLLSADLRVYDVVADELRYGMRLLPESGGAKVPAALTQLAVGSLAQTFAVAVPHVSSSSSSSSSSKKKNKSAPLWPASRLLVFSPDHVQPLFVRELPTLVVSLLPAVGSSGFLALDAAAQIWSLADAAADTAPLGRSLADLNLPTTTAEAADDPQALQTVDAAEGEDDEDDEGDDDDKDMRDASDDDDDSDVDMHDAVIAPQQLRDIFEAAPAATSTTSITDLFWQVSGLLSGGPNVVRAT